MEWYIELFLYLFCGPLLAILIPFGVSVSRNQGLSLWVSSSISIILTLGIIGFLFSWLKPLALVFSLISSAGFCIPAIILISNEERQFDVSIRRKFVMTTVFIQFFLLGCFFLYAPGYMFPFLNHPVIRLILLGLLCWQFIGVGIYCAKWQMKRRILNYILFVLFFAVFVVPIILSFIIGPILVTIGILNIFRLPFFQ